MRYREDYAWAVFTALVLVVALVLVFSLVRLAARMNEIAKECLHHGYSGSRGYSDGGAFCVRMEDRSTAVVPLEDLDKEE